MIPRPNPSSHHTAAATQVATSTTSRYTFDVWNSRQAVFIDGSATSLTPRTSNSAGIAIARRPAPP